MQADSAANSPDKSRSATDLPASPRILVTFPTYNEKENIVRLVPEVHGYLPLAHVLVIDDNSPDGTGVVADEMAARDPRVHVLHRAGKLGLGTATLAAMRYAMEHDYDYMLNMDADFSHPPRYIPALVAGMARKDVMIGSRYVTGGGTSGWPLKRKVLSRGVNTLVRFLFRMGVRDASGAFRCYRVSLLRAARLDRVRSRGYSFQQEVLHACHQAGGQFGETPILFENRKFGYSKVSLRESIRSISMLAYLGVKSYFRRPLHKPVFQR